MDEQRLERALRQGPPFATRYVARPLALDQRRVGRRPAGVGRLVLLVALTGMVMIGMLAGLAALGALRDDESAAENGWVAFTRGRTEPAGGERDIYLVREGEVARRVIGADADGLDQICPAFSLDGARLAHGEAERSSHGSYRNAALVISDVTADGEVTESLRLDVGTLPPPCAAWSPDGGMVAFGVPGGRMAAFRQPAIWKDIWVVTLDDLQIDIVSGVFASDLEWSPDGTQLAIVRNHTVPLSSDDWRGRDINLYTVGSGNLRALVDRSGVSSLSWSPDGQRIAFQAGIPEGRNQEIRVVEADGSAEYVLASGFSTDHGIGPVWAPGGDWIVYQRLCDINPLLPSAPCREQSEVVLIPTAGGFGGREPGDGEVVLPHLHLPGADESALWFPYFVTWSPDGEQLLYTAWGGPIGDVALIARPIDDPSAAVPLHDASGMSHEGPDISVYAGDGALPVQAWGRRPE